MGPLFFWTWPWRQAAGHMLVLLLLGGIAVELLLYGFEKIPFTCSYLPGKSYFHMAVLAFLGFAVFVNKGYKLERSALEDGGSYLKMVGVLLVVLGGVYWRTAARARQSEATLHFEEEQEPAIFGLGLDRDGVMVPGKNFSS